MAGNLLNIGKTGLYAAQTALSTTGHNISNVNTPGYSRQLVLQATGLPQDTGRGFIGSGTQVTTIQRYSNDFLNTQLRSAQATSSSLDTYQAQIAQVDNLLSDPATGVSPAIQDFFASVQSLNSNAASVPARNLVLSSAATLAARFQGADERLAEIGSGVDSQIEAGVNTINTYAQQLAQLNHQIAQLSNGTGQPPNDLLDTRDQLILDLNKQVKAQVTPGENNSLTISIGSGQPLVVGDRAFELGTMVNNTAGGRLEVGFVNGSKLSLLPASMLAGGELGGMLQFRSQTLEPARDALGKLALTMAVTINDQHHLGQDSAGNLGKDMFTVPAAHGFPYPGGSGANTDVQATMVDPTAFTQSDYKVSYDGAAYSVTRLSDGQVTPITSSPQVVNGLSFSMTGPVAAGDSFLVRPTAVAAGGFDLNLKDASEVAAGAPVLASAAQANRGTVTVTKGSVDINYLTPGNALVAGAPVVLSYDGPTGALNGFPPTQDVTVTDATGAATTYLAGTTVPYVDGASYSFGGITMKMTGKPADKDSFTIEKSSGTVTDNRNMLLIAALQTKPITDPNGNRATFQASYAQLVSTVGNKAREVQVNASASTALLDQATTAQQNVSGVNLDEEAAALIKYQQAYQAAGKVMQIASTLFDTLLQLGH
jgi:flagellar hook-associated protein 1 FlgK